jgi:uncharacterized protein (TIGR03437 family)
MRKCAFAVVLLGLASCNTALFAQTPPQLPACLEGLDQGTVGVPYFCDYGTALDQFFAPFFGAGTGITLTFTFNVTAGSTLPPGLAITRSGVFSGTPTAPGSFDYSIDINFTISVSGSQAFSETSPFPSILQVNAGGPGTTLVSPGGLVFALNQGTTVSSQSIGLSSRGSQPVTYTATAATSSGGGWLSVSQSGTLNPFQSTAAVAAVNAAGLASGTYSGTISFALSSGENFTVPVVLTVTSNQQSLILSQTGLFFQAVQGGSAPPSQSVSVLNGGAGSLSFTASASTLSGGNWLSVSPSSGTATAAASGAATVTANSAGLAPGAYYGTVQFSAAGVPNSPQTISVVLTVASPAQSPGPSLSTTGLIFVTQPGGSATAKTITVTNPSPNPLTYSSTVFSDSSTSFYSVAPANGTVASAQPLSISVQPTAAVPSGVYTGNLTLVFSDATTQTIYQRRVAIVLIVISSTGSVAHARIGPLADACTPTKLIPVFTQLGDSFKVAAAWPAPLEVTVVDDCGAFMNQGTVISLFSTADPPIALTSLQDGRWAGTWQPRSTSSNQVTITVQAQQSSPPLKGSAQIGGALQTNPAVPVVNASGVVSAASNTQRQPLAPGSYIAIYGNNLSSGSFSAPSLPLQTKLGGTQVILAGKLLPLNFAGNGQINAIVPFDIPVNAVQQLIVQQNGALSVPEPVVLSPAQPAIFTQDFSGQGLGIIVGFKADGSATNFLVDHTHPVSAGDTLVIYCTGLGPVDQPATAGDAGPSSTLANALNPVTATIGGINATVLYAGLAPQLTVYQMNIIVPPGVTPGSDVPIVLSQAGLQSVPVTITVK